MFGQTRDQQAQHHDQAKCDDAFGLLDEDRGGQKQGVCARNESRAHSWRSVVAWHFLVHSPRAICAALTMQRSLGGRPQRSDRSQSPQVNSGGRRSATTVLANLAKTSWIAVRMAVLPDKQDLSATRRPGVLIKINSKRNPAPEIAMQSFAGGRRPLIWINAPGRQMTDS